MANDASDVVVGKPKATGGVYAGATTATLPTSPYPALSGGLRGLGYVADDGLTMTKGGDIQVIRAWGGEPVKIVKATDDVTFGWTFIETSDDVLKEVFGEDQVTVSGLVTTVKINGTQVGPRSWVFEILDGDFAIRVVVPNADMTGEAQCRGQQQRPRLREQPRRNWHADAGPDEDHRGGSTESEFERGHVRLWTSDGRCFGSPPPGDRCRHTGAAPFRTNRTRAMWSVRLAQAWLVPRWISTSPTFIRVSPTSISAQISPSMTMA